MSNIITDIVDDYKRDIKKGITETYYKKDIIEGIKLIATIVGIVKIAMLIGGASAALIGSIFSYAANHPQAAARCVQIISKNSDDIEKLINSAGETFNKGYNSLSGKDKKCVRTVVLLIAKNGIDWSNLH